MTQLQTGYLEQAESLLSQGRAWAGLPIDALGYVLANVTRAGRWLVVLDGADRLDQLHRAVQFFLDDARHVETFPADDHRPYDGFSPDPTLVRQRLKTLEKVRRGADLTVLTTARALLQRVPDEAARSQGTRTLKPEDTLDRDAFIAWLTDAGYLATPRADEAGRFAVRGDVVDVWPASARAPVRIDFFDDEIESLRRLDGRTLRPKKVIRKITLIPAREARIDEAAVERALDELARLTQHQSDGGPRRRRVIEELRSGIRFSAVEDYLPALVSTEPPLDALAGLTPIVVVPGDVEAALRDFEGTAKRRYDLLGPDERPIVPPAERYVSAQTVIAQLEGAHQVHDLPADSATDLGARPIDDLVVRGADLGPVVSRLAHLADEDVGVALVVDDEDREDRLLQMLEPHGLRPARADDARALRRGKVTTLIGDLPRGFVAKDSGLAYVPVHAMFGGAQRRRVRERAHALFEGAVQSMADLKVGDPVVHRRHGVGRYLGLVRLDVSQGVAQDFVKLEYRNAQHMFLPVAALDQLSRYRSANPEAKVVLDKLGGQTWTNRKRKVRDHLFSMAQDLLALFARRELATREPYPEPGPRYRAFEARFPYEETPDQAEAIAAVQDDLSKAYPMDRLVCGDVGFGKTEVAMRAAMRAVEAGRQVAVLAPTTVLAYQHHQSFRDRFAADPQVEVRLLSRFVSPADERQAIAGLKQGDVNIVVGTTAILGRRVTIPDLGLVVIDEEHRFGVKQKARLKRMRAAVDVLALSATPIPRTLQMAMSGVREMSIIATPPKNRLEVRTTVARMTESRVRDAILSELDRGGQAFVIHNRVETIDRFANQLRQWMPEVRFAVAHGQMEAENLERVMVDFVAHAHDVLISTAIVESGIDLPNVNTMLVHRADQFGIAQLYQLRGRVGRSDRRAQCILLVPETITGDARRRLRVIVDNQRLGSGFSVASADLEIRGGGNLLGSAQSGNIDQVGYETWLELLDEAVRGARGDLDRQLVDPDIEVPADAFLPDDYVPDEVRLGWYKRFSNATTPSAIERILDDLTTEFGEPPDAARNLGQLMAARILAREVGVVRATVLKVRVRLDLHESSPLTEAQLSKVVERHPKRFSVDERTVFVRFTPREGERPYRFLRWALVQLTRTEE
ncbi:MAG: transcription-repair coupling factor [Myxococcota bacterium]